MSMYWIAEAVYKHTGVFGIFGIPDVVQVRLRVSSFLFAIVFGTLIYAAFERPFERLRASLRRRRRSHAAVNSVEVGRPARYLQLSAATGLSTPDQQRRPRYEPVRCDTTQILRASSGRVVIVSSPPSVSAPSVSPARAKVTDLRENRKPRHCLVKTIFVVGKRSPDGSSCEDDVMVSSDPATL